MFGFGAGEMIVVLVLVAIAAYAVQRGKARRVVEGVEDEFARLLRKWEGARPVEQLNRAVQQNWNDKVELGLNYGECGKAINELEQIRDEVAALLQGAEARFKEFQWAVRNPQAFEGKEGFLETARVKIEPTRAGILALEEDREAINRAIAVAQGLHGQISNRLEVLKTISHFHEAQVEPLARLHGATARLRPVASSTTTSGSDRFSKAREKILDDVETMDLRLGALSRDVSSEAADEGLANHIKAIRTDATA